MTHHLKRSNGIPFLFLVLYVFLLTGCSSFTDFVVINESADPIEVKYKVRKSTAGPLVASGLPAAIEASRLSTSGGTEWQQLNPGQFQLAEEPEVDVVLVRLASKQVLRLTSMRTETVMYGSGQGLPITEIVISGRSGKLEFSGDRARTGFSKISKALYAITYKSAPL